VTAFATTAISMLGHSRATLYGLNYAIYNAGSIGMALFRKHVYAVALLTAIGLLALLAVLLINAAKDGLLEASDAGDLSRVKFLLAIQTNVNVKARYN
jgi:hypothetical protein